MATHDRMEALRFSDRIAVMNQGKIFQIGSPYEVMNHPVDRVRGFLCGGGNDPGRNRHQSGIKEAF